MKKESNDTVRARLAGVDVVSMKAVGISETAENDKEAALLRVESVLGLERLNAAPALEAMMMYLRRMKITINFGAHTFYKNSPRDSYLNRFEMGHQGGYMTERDNVEERLFNYSNDRAVVGADNRQQEAIDRIKRLGSVRDDNASFIPSIRPKYAAIHFDGNRNGAASGYGKSFLVLKDRVKINCTLLDRDSMNYGGRVNIADKTANYENLYRVFANLLPHKLRTIYRMTTGIEIDNSSLNSNTDYIEVQLHSPILFNRDVEKIVIDREELNQDAQGWKAKPRMLYYQLFARKYGIGIEFI